MKAITKFLTALSFTAYVSLAHSATPPDVLKQYYGKYNAALKCYTYHAKDDQGDFCMKVVAQKQIPNASGNLLYVVTSGVTYDPKTNVSSPVHVEAGNNGIFIFQEQNNQYKLLAFDKDLSLSSMGEGANKWTFHQFAPNVWGAMTETGDGHSGVGGSRFIILTPQNNKIITSWIGNSFFDTATGLKDCEKHPTQCTDLSATIKIDKSTTVNSYYPLLLTVNGNELKRQYNNKVYKIVYTPQKGYVEPKQYPLANRDY